jgi:hypothetical protein
MMRERRGAARLSPETGIPDVPMGTRFADAMTTACNAVTAAVDACSTAGPGGGSSGAPM